MSDLPRRGERDDVSEPLFICGNTYLGFRDDVPRGCQGCSKLKVMQRSAATVYMMPCQNRHDILPGIFPDKEAQHEAE